MNREYYFRVFEGDTTMTRWGVIWEGTMSGCSSRVVILSGIIAQLSAPRPGEEATEPARS